MTPPRWIKHGTSYYVTVRAVNRSFRFVPRARIRAAIDYVLAAVLAKYREDGRLQLNEFLFMSNHYHLLVTDAAKCLPDFIQDLNSLLSRQLNAMRKFGGANIEREYNLVEIVGEARVTEHAVYTLLNPVRARLVTKARHWKGSSSVRMEYGKAITVKRPKLGLWKGELDHAKKKASKRSGRAAYAGRWTTPDSAELVIERPAVMMHLSDVEYRAHVRELVEAKEAVYSAARAKEGKGVVGWREVIKRHFLSVPGQPEELFSRVPTFSSSFPWERMALIVLRRRFVKAYRAARKRFLARARKVVFPYGTWQVCSRLGAPAAPPG